MTLKAQLGRKGESIACFYLNSKGYKIIERNYREKWGEVDVIAKSTDETLVFIEVKTMQGKSRNGLTPEDQITRAKLEKFSRIARFYAAKNSHIINEEKGWRLDVIAITKESKSYRIKHYKNIPAY